MFILSETSREMLAIFLIAVTGYLIGREIGRAHV